MLTWNASGIRRHTKHIPNGPLNWPGWSHQYSVLQPDGSILVALSGDDPDLSRALLQRVPLRVSQAPYFCRLMPPDFALDVNFGNGGHVVQRAPGCEFVVPQTNPPQIPNSAESQWPLAMQRLANNQVIAAIRCKHCVGHQPGDRCTEPSARWIGRRRPANLDSLSACSPQLLAAN